MTTTSLRLPEGRPAGILAILAAAVLWSTSGLFIKILDLSVWQIAGYRAIFAAAAFGLVFRRQVLDINLRSALNGLAYSGITLSFVMANKLTTAANVIFLQYTAPLYILLAEPLLFKIPLRRSDVLTLGVCLAGMGMVLAGGVGPGDLRGNLLALLAGLLLAVFMLGQRLNPSRYHASAIFLGNCYTFLICLPLHISVPPPAAGELFTLALVGIFQLGAAYALFTYGLRRVLAIEASLFAMIEPVLNPLWVFLATREQPGPWAIAGGLTVVGALALRALLEREKRKA